MRRVLAEELGLDPGPELAGLQAQVLADDPALAAPAQAPVPGGPGPAAAEGAGPGVVPRQLPAGAGFFAGREAELKQLDELLDRATGQSAADEPGGAVVISAVAGMAGVGKTALAVHWARRVAGRFPDGQLHVNPRGYDAASWDGRRAAGSAPGSSRPGRPAPRADRQEPVPALSGGRRRATRRFRDHRTRLPRHGELVTCRDIASTPPAHRGLAC